MLGPVLGRRRIDRHAADGVLRERARGLGESRRQMVLVFHGRDRYTFPSWEGQADSRNEHRRGGGLERSHRQDDPPLRGDRPVAPRRAPRERLSRLWRARSSRIADSFAEPGGLAFQFPKSANCWLYGAIAAARAAKSSASPRRISAIFNRASPRCRRWRTRSENSSPHATATIDRTARSSMISRSGASTA